MPRNDPDLAADELTTLVQFLDFHRATLVEKVSGLDAAQLATASAPPSTMTLGGLVKHLALVEDDWFQVRLLGLPDPAPWADAPFDDDPDWEWHSAAQDTPAALLALYAAACARSRDAVAAVDGDLERLSVTTDRQTGGHYSLRWILVHMIEETARHAGHLDLMREQIDGKTGD